MFSFNEISCVSKDENWTKNRFVSFFCVKCGECNKGV